MYRGGVEHPRRADENPRIFEWTRDHPSARKSGEKPYEEAVRSVKHPTVMSTIETVM